MSSLKAKKGALLQPWSCGALSATWELRAADPAEIQRESQRVSLQQDSLQLQQAHWQHPIYQTQKCGLLRNKQTVPQWTLSGLASETLKCIHFPS